MQPSPLACDAEPHQQRESRCGREAHPHDEPAPPALRGRPLVGPGIHLGGRGGRLRPPARPHRSNQSPCLRRGLGVVLRGDSPGERLVGFQRARPIALDRKSTRLNSSHLVISYAVFCLKKKKKKKKSRNREKYKKKQKLKNN